MTDAHKILKKAYNLLLNGRCIHAIARTRWGTPVSFNDHNAHIYCAYGAICRAKTLLNICSPDEPLNTAYIIFRFISGDGYGSIDKWNDTVEHYDVLKVFEQAIEETA